MKFLALYPSRNSSSVAEASVHAGKMIGDQPDTKRRGAHAIRIGAVILLAFLCVTSCTHLRSGTAVKAGFDADSPPGAVGLDSLAPKESWASRHVPGWKAVQRLLPPPTEARRKWEDHYQSRSRMYEDGDAL